SGFSTGNPRSPAASVRPRSLPRLLDQALDLGPDGSLIGAPTLNSVCQAVGNTDAGAIGIAPPGRQLSRHCPSCAFCLSGPSPSDILARVMLGSIDPTGAVHRPGGTGLRNGYSDVSDHDAGGEGFVQRPRVEPRDHATPGRRPRDEPGVPG